MQGLSTELGAFVAGVMMSATEQQENTLHQLEPLKQFFLSLFICSTGLIMSPTFLAQHLRVLAGGLVVTVLSKTVLVSRRHLLCRSNMLLHLRAATLAMPYIMLLIKSLIATVARSHVDAFHQRSRRCLSCNMHLPS